MRYTKQQRTYLENMYTPAKRDVPLLSLFTLKCRYVVWACERYVGVLISAMKSSAHSPLLLSQDITFNNITHVYKKPAHQDS
jgi:hypothetical protein